MTTIDQADIPHPVDMSLNGVPDGVMKDYYKEIVFYMSLYVQRWTAFHLAKIAEGRDGQLNIAFLPRSDSHEYISLEQAMAILAEP